MASLFLILSLWLPIACDDPLHNGSGENEPYLYVNTFARNTINLYYLWNAEITDAIMNWKDTEEPIAKVADIRYHSGSGDSRVDIDRWTTLYDDFSAFYGSVTGNQKTYGFVFKVYPSDEEPMSARAVVTYTYADSPARKAGLKRGDCIVKVNGKSLTLTTDENGDKDLSPEAYDIIYQELLGGESLEVELQGSPARTIRLDAVEMYEDPVLLSKVFDCGGKKVGYLLFTSFTLDACKDLLRVAKEYKAEGVSELILDLRYNGGGFVITENFLASLLAPEAEVQAGSVLSTEVFNAEVTDYIQRNKEDNRTYFKTRFDFNKGTEDAYSLSSADANIGITKLYAIISSGSASASEAILCDLFPYLDITLVGQQTHGKYCSGIMMEGPDFYDDYAEQLQKQRSKGFVEKGKRFTENWGLYVMYSRFADKNGVTRCMPNGLTPDVEVKDNPLDSYLLGDPQETMLAAALRLAGYPAKAPAAHKAQDNRQPARPLEGIDPFRPEFGMRIILPKQ